MWYRSKIPIWSLTVNNSCSFRKYIVPKVGDTR
jgi:hypothetical protein